jgi:hypothetical protein
MPVIRCYVSDKAYHVLQRKSAVDGRSIEALAEGAIESAAIAELPRGYAGGQQHFDLERGDRERAAWELRSGWREEDLP